MKNKVRSCWNANPEKWEKILNDYLIRSNATLISRPEILNNKSRVITQCKHGIIERGCGCLEKTNSCCKRGSKEVPSWNSLPEKWEKILSEFLERNNCKLVYKPERLHAKSRVELQCKHGINSRFCETLEYSNLCCRYDIDFKKPLLQDCEKEGILYLIEYPENDILHYKLGITKNSLKSRFRSRKVKPIELWNLPIWKCFDFEQKALRYAEENGWRYRCSSTTELIDTEGIHMVKEFINSLCLV